MLPLFERHFSRRGVRRDRQEGDQGDVATPVAVHRAVVHGHGRSRRPPSARSAKRRLPLKVIYRLHPASVRTPRGRGLRERVVIRVSLRDLQWRRRRFVIVVFVAALAFGLALVMTGVTNQLSQEGTNTVELFDADQWVVAEGVSGPFTTSQLIDRKLSDSIAADPGVDAASPILIGRTLIGDRDVNVVGYDPASEMLPDQVGRGARRACPTQLRHRTGQSPIRGSPTGSANGSCSVGPSCRSSPRSTTPRSTSARPRCSFRSPSSRTCCSPARTSPRQWSSTVR